MRIIFLIFSIALMQVDSKYYNRHKNLTVGESKEEQKSFLHKIIFGGENRLDVNDKHVKELLNWHVPRLRTGDGENFIIEEIKEISTQIVAGVLYRVKGHYKVEGEKKICVISILERNWLESEKIIISAKCDDGSCYVSESYTCSKKSLEFL